MTRKEQTGVRNLDFSGWIREKLPDSKTGFMVSDLDFIFYNYKTKKLMLVEVKTRKGKMRTWQERLFIMLDKLIKASAADFGIKYYGFKCIRFESTSFKNGRCVVDGIVNRKVVTESELIKILSME